MLARLSPPVVLVLGMAWLAAEFVALGKFSGLAAGDNSELIVSGLLRFRFSELAFPLWDNFSAAGSDRRSLAFVGFLDVELFRLFPGWLAYMGRVVSHVLIAVLAAYALARRTFGFSPWTATFCALAYGLLDPSMLFNSTFAYFPLLVLAATLVLQRKADALRWLLLVVSVALLVGTAYFSRVFPFASVALIAWFLFVDFRRSLGDWLIIGATAAAIPVLLADTIVALIAQAPLSHLPLVRFQPTPGAVVEILLRAPWFFLNFPAIAFTALFGYALSVHRLTVPRIRGLLALFVLGTLAPIAAVALQVTLLSTLKFIGGFDLFRLWLVPASVLPFAAGYGVEALLGRARDGNEKRRGLHRGALAAAIGVLLVFSLQKKWASAKDWIGQGNFAHNFESPVLGELAERIRAEPLPVRAETFQMYPTYLHAYGIETAGGYQPVFSRRTYEYWVKMLEPWAMSLPADHEMWGPHAKSLAAAAGNPREFRGDRLMLLPADHAPERRLGDLYRFNMLSLANVGYVVSRDRFLDDALEPLREASKPWSALTTREKIAINFRANFRGREHLYVYRNRNVFPRIFSVAGLRVFPDGAATLEAVARASPDDLRRHAFVEAGALPAGLAPGAAFEPIVVELEPQRSDVVAFRARGGPGFVVVTNSYSPFWVCLGDGRPLPLIPVYHAFWGIPLDGSVGTVTCRYRPPTLLKSLGWR